MLTEFRSLILLAYKETQKGEQAGNGRRNDGSDCLIRQWMHALFRRRHVKLATLVVEAPAHLGHSSLR